MTDWAPYMTGLPNVVIKELEIHYGAGTISAATYGRGIWESPVNTISMDIYEMSEEQFNSYRQKLAQDGPKHAKKYNWESSFKKHMDLFETILN